MFLKSKASKIPVLSPVITHVESIKAFSEALHIGGADSLQEVDVVLRVEAAHVMLGGLVWLEDLRMETQGESRQGQSRSGLRPPTLNPALGTVQDHT